MFGIGMTELMVIFVIGLVVLGPKRLPEVARTLGKSLAEFRRASNEMRREFMEATEEANIVPPALPHTAPAQPAPPTAAAVPQPAPAATAPKTDTPPGDPPRDG
jgi:Tat protein translocase TatB subunit